MKFPCSLMVHLSHRLAFAGISLIISFDFLHEVEYSLSLKRDKGRIWKELDQD